MSTESLTGISTGSDRVKACLRLPAEAERRIAEDPERNERLRNETESPVSPRLKPEKRTGAEYATGTTSPETAFTSALAFHCFTSLRHVFGNRNVRYSAVCPMSLSAVLSADTYANDGYVRSVKPSFPRQTEALTPIPSILPETAGETNEMTEEFSMTSKVSAKRIFAYAYILDLSSAPSTTTLAESDSETALISAALTDTAKGAFRD